MISRNKAAIGNQTGPDSPSVGKMNRLNAELPGALKCISGQGFDLTELLRSQPASPWGLWSR
jgi:hypothetical protein